MEVKQTLNESQWHESHRQRLWVNIDMARKLVKQSALVPLLKQLQQQVKPCHYCLPFTGAKSLLNSGQRVAQHINQSLSRLQAQITQDTLKVFIGHGASFRHAVYHLKLLEFEQISQLSMFHDQPIFFKFLGNQNYSHIAGEWKVRAIG